MVMEDRPSGAAVGPELAGKTRKLVVCCVELDAAQLQPAFDVLAMRGFEIVLIERQDVRPPALAEHAQRHGVDAVFVFARAIEAPESSVPPLEGALRTARIAPDHISTLAIDWRDPMALVEHVAALAGASRTTDTPILRTTTTSPQKQVTGPYATVPPPPTVPAAKETTGGRRTLAVKVELSSASPPAAPPEPTPAPAPAPTPVVAAIEPVVAPVEPPPAAPPTIVEQALPEPPEPRLGRLQTVTAVLRPLAAMTTSRSRRAWSWVASSRARIAAVSGVAVATVLAVAFVASRNGDTNAKDDGTAAPAVATAVDPPAPSTSSAAPSDTTGTAAADSAALVAQARKRGELGMHEGIVFAPVHAPKRRFAAAKKLCEDMNAGALKGWRMPTLAELHVLAVARVIDRGVYWSGTEEDAFGPQALIWSEKKSAAVPITKAWSGARALCVRDDGAPD